MLLGFVHDCGRILRQREARACLLGVAVFYGLLAAAIVQSVAAAADSTAALLNVALIVLGIAAGRLMALAQRHPTRLLGLVPFAATGLAMSLLVAAASQPPPGWQYGLIGLTGGLGSGPLLTTCPTTVPAACRGRGLALLILIGCAAAVGVGLFMAGLSRRGMLGDSGPLWLLAALAVAGAAVAWRVFLRDAYELTLAVLFWPIYRVRGCGPGLGRFPRTGPVLVVANHACWFDPIFLGKLLPRRLIAMLTSDFYDIPILHFLAARVVQCIRVPVSGYRHEAPELAEAVAALDRGECVLVFPEGQMRKREDRPLHRFGRGVWHILRQRPATPVVVCWIEGAWGSSTSYCNGPPAKTKRLDFWRPILVGVREPEVLDESILADHRTTRDYLMKQCLDARRFVGLEPYPESALRLPAKSQPAADQS